MLPGKAFEVSRPRGGAQHSAPPAMSTCCLASYLSKQTLPSISCFGHGILPQQWKSNTVAFSDKSRRTLWWFCICLDFYA